MNTSSDIFLGLDIGTSTLCAVALDGRGRLIGSESLPNDSAVPDLPAGHREQSPRRILNLCLDLLRRLHGAIAPGAGSVQALGLTGQMHGVLLADERLDPLSNLITWQDRRADEPVPGADRTFLEDLTERVPAGAFADTGSRPAAGYMASTLYRLSRGPGLPERARWALLVHDWVAAALAGAPPATDPTDAASTGLYNLRLGAWDERIMSAAAIDGALLPYVREAGGLIGSLSPETAEATGLPKEVTVHVPLGDNQASVLASLREPDVELLVNIGTGGQVSAVTYHFLTGADLDVRPFPGGRLLSVGASLCGGSAFTYLAEHYARTIAAVTGRDLGPSGVLDALVRLAAAAPPGANGLTVEPLFAGRRSAPASRGSVSGMSAENNAPGHWARAFIEGIVRELAGYYQQMLAAGLAPRVRLTGSGNGMRLNPVMRDAAARTFGMPVAIPKWREEAACGAALAAMVGAGALGSFREASTLVQYEADPSAGRD